MISLLEKTLPHGQSEPHEFDWSAHNANVHSPANEGKFMECPRELFTFYLGEVAESSPLNNVFMSNLIDLEESLAHWQQYGFSLSSYITSLQEKIPRGEPAYFTKTLNSRT